MGPSSPPRLPPAVLQSCTSRVTDLVLRAPAVDSITKVVCYIRAGMPEAARLYEMLATRYPEEIFAAYVREEWDAWVAFFSQTRESDGRRKGLVELTP